MKITRRSVPVKAAINKLPAGIKPADTPVKDYAEELASAVCKSLTDNGYICEYKVSTKSIVFTVAVDTNADIDINFTLPLSAIVPEATVSADMATVVDKIMNLAPLTSPGTDVDLTAEVTSATDVKCTTADRHISDSIYGALYDSITKEEYAAKWELPVSDITEETEDIAANGYGNVVGYLWAKPRYYDALCENGIEGVYVLEDGTVGMTVGGRFYDITRDIDLLIARGLLPDYDDLTAEVTSTTKVQASEYRQYEDQEYDGADILSADDLAKNSCFATLWPAYIDDEYKCACCGKSFPAGHNSVHLNDHKPDGMHFIFEYTKENREGNSVNYDPYNLPKEDPEGGIFKVVVGEDADDEGYHWLNFCRNCWPKLTSMPPDEIYARYSTEDIQGTSVLCSTDMSVTNYLNDFGDATVEALWSGYGIKAKYEVHDDNLTVYFYSVFRSQKPWTHVTRSYDELYEIWGSDPISGASAFADELVIRTQEIDDEMDIEGATGVENIDDKEPVLGGYKDDEAYKKLLEYDYILDTSDDGCVIKFSDGDPYATFRFVAPTEEELADGLDEWLIYADGDLINERLDYYPTNYDEAVKTAIRYFWSHY